MTPDEWDAYVAEAGEQPAEVSMVEAPHSEAQHEIFNHICYNADYPNGGCCTLLAGRRWGKGILGWQILSDRGMNRSGLYQWIGYEWSSSSMKEAWNRGMRITERLWRALRQDPKPYINKSDHELHWPNGTEIWFRVQSNARSLPGSGPMGIIGDEWPMWEDDIWSEYLGPSTIDVGAWATASVHL